MKNGLESKREGKKKNVWIEAKTKEYKKLIEF